MPNLPNYGNLHISSITWGKLLRLYREGRIIVLIVGALYEIWLVARHNTMPEILDNPSRQIRWPLRSATRIFVLQD